MKQATIMNYTKNEEKKSKYKCYTCGVPIQFKKGQNKKRFNMDGTEHFCKTEDKQKYQNTEDFKDRYNKYQEDREARRKRWLRWWWGYGYNRYGRGTYRESYNRYNRKEYEDRWNQAREERKKYQEQYYNKFLDISGALEILGIERSEFDKIPEAEKDQRFRLVRSKYREIALINHPDKFNAKNPQATEAQKEESKQKFIKATEAFEFLEQKIFKQ